MSHPMRGAASDSSRSKMKALTGHAKTGRPHLNESERTKAFATSFRKHHDQAVGGHKAKVRLDRRARGGSTGERNSAKREEVGLDKNSPFSSDSIIKAGGAAKYARGGRTKKSHIKINIINNKPAPGIPPAGPMGPMGGAPAGVTPPPAVAGLGAPGMPMRARGGGVSKGKGIVKGEGTLTGPDKASLNPQEQKKFLGVKKRAAGGKVGFPKMRAGMGSGEGRLELSKKQKKIR